MRKSLVPLEKIKLYGEPASVEQLAAEPGGEYLQIKEMYILSSARGTAEERIVALEEDESIELVLEDETVWFGDRNTILEIFPELTDQNRSSNDTVELPSFVEAEDSSRGFFGKIAVKLFKIFIKKAVDKQVVKIATDFEKKLLEGRSGLYGLDKDFGFTPNPVIDPSLPILILIHGTAASTEKSFKDLKGSPLWATMCNRYGSNTFCFEHESLTKSPFQNAFELAQKLPDGAKLHIVSTSRGGLIGELLVRFSENIVGFPPEVFTLLHNKKRDADLKMMQNISFEFKNKKISVERFVRIACPGRGTSILSNRVDFFLNVILNLLVAATGPFAPLAETVKALISAALDGKNDPAVLPGLEVQNPASVFNKALNSPNFNGGTLEGFENQLYVIAGNSKASLSLRGLGVLLLKLVFLRQNDMVVDTVSMYQGSYRKKPIQYFFDEGADVNHFSYFKNKPTTDAIELALMSNNERIPLFRLKQLGFTDDTDRGILGIEGGRLYPTKPRGDKPIVILLPGIMGSALEQDKKHIWLNYLQIPFGGLERIEINQPEVKASSLIRSAYQQLTDYLGSDYDVQLFPFDWRKSVTESGNQLGLFIEELSKLKQPIKIIAHSMGGLVVREMMVSRPEIWKALNQDDKFRLILLGTPWMGSYRIPHVLCGKDSMLKQINIIDFKHSDDQLVDMFSKYPGLLNLLPLAASDIDFTMAENWKVFQKSSKLNWTIPSGHLLNSFKQFKTNVLSNIAGLDYSKIIYVAGKHAKTPKYYRINSEQIEFDYTSEGDESVTWESGIPGNIDRDNNLYYVNVSHGSLANKESLFLGIKELLETGRTTEATFSKQPIQTTDSKRSYSEKESFEFESTVRSLESSILGLESIEVEDSRQLPILKVSVTNGDLAYCKAPLLIGHFAKDGILFAEAVADKYMSRSLSLKHTLGSYPELVGDSEIFLPTNNHWFIGCIVAGLGQAEYLTAQQLMTTIEKAVVNYLLMYWRNRPDKKHNLHEKITLSSLLIAAGYGGLSIENSCRAIMQGVANANARFSELIPNDNIYVQELEFIELFEDKAVQCFLSIDKLMNGNNDSMNIAWNYRRIRQVPGARKRLLGDASSDWWQRLSVLSKPADNTNNRSLLSFYSSTNSAREERGDSYYNIEIVEAMLEDISIRRNWSFEKSRAIFELLIPNDFKENIRRNAPVLWVLDNYSAGFPWELLQTGTKNDKPLCVSAGMVRQLAISDYTTAKSLIRTNNVLVIGDPNLRNLSMAKQLNGAKAEALMVHKLLSNFDLNLSSPLIGSDSDQIVTSLFKTEYKIVHIAAHGVFNEADPSQSGIIIGKKKNSDQPLLLTPHEFSKLPCPPEFVFINCCHLGRVNSFAEELSANRFKLAANIGTQLIKNGVKAVIVSGWEVDDAAALEFATVFYREMFESNCSFGDAVREAREKIYNNFRHTNTWGAYQCYGDPHFKFNNILTKKDKKSTQTNEQKLPQQIENELDALLSKSQIRFYQQDELLIELNDLSKALEKITDVSPEIIEKQATAYVELGDYKKALPIYESLFKMNKASYDVRSLERYQEIYSRQKLKNYLADKRSVSKCITGVKHAIDKLVKLRAISITPRRCILLAELNKRLAFLHTDKKKRNQCLIDATNYYHEASNASGSTGLFAFSNWVLMEKLLQVNKIVNKQKKSRSEKIQVLDFKKLVATIEDKLVKEDKNEPDEYWKMTVATQALISMNVVSEKFDEVQAGEKFKHLWNLSASNHKREFQLEYLDLLVEFFGTAKSSKMSGYLKRLRASVIWNEADNC